MSDLLNNRYRILQTLGSGGCGQTFLAEDTHMPSRRRCVVKQLKPQTDDPATCQIIRERFWREATLLESLGRSHDQIPDLYAYFTEGGEFYLVQEWVEGESLAQRVKEEGPLNERQVRDFLVSLLPVLGYVHAQGVIHRDIKPENVMLRGRDGKPVLIDFGAVKEIVATLTDSRGTPTSSIVVGSPGFMPVEQAAGKPVFASDLYSLGLTAIYLLTGKRPQELSDMLTGEIAWREYAAAAGPELAAALDKATRPLAQERYRTAGEMLDALLPRDSASDLTVRSEHAPHRARPEVPPSPPNVPPPGGPLPQPGGGGGRRRLTYAIVSLLAIAVIGAAVAFVYGRRDNSSPASGSPGLSPVSGNPERSPAGQPAAQTAEFEVTLTNDRFTSVRASPRATSPEIRRLNPGTMVTCQTTAMRGESLWNNNEWRYCPSAGGYIHSTLLKPVQ